MRFPGFEQADEFADAYDETVQQYGWNSPQVVFELVEEYLHPGDSLLDLGIGTGLSAIPFSEAGVRVFGVDGSSKMLERCEDKEIAVELTQHDIRSTPLPFNDGSFDHVIACGVFHLIGHLDGIFADVKRLSRGVGSFAFTVERLEPVSSSDGELIEGGVLEIANEKSAVLSYRHSHDHVEDLLHRNGFNTVKTYDYVAYRKTDWADERKFRAYVTRHQDKG